MVPADLGLAGLQVAGVAQKLEERDQRDRRQRAPRQQRGDEAPDGRQPLRAGDARQREQREEAPTAILRAAGATLENVVEVHALLARPDDFAGFNEEYARVFPVDPPTRAVAKLGVEVPNLLVSIRMTAVLES